jgi:hypothetical protein
MPMFTKEELAAQQITIVAQRDAGNAMVTHADANEAALDVVITECGYDPAEIMELAYFGQP